MDRSEQSQGGRKVWEPGATARFISTLLEDLASLKPQTHPKVPGARACWEKPPMGWTKLNTDAGFVQSSCSGSAGVVLRDHSGALRGAAGRWLDDVPDALTAEALVAKEGIELAMELGVDRLILEVDCQGLAKMLMDPASIRSSIRGLWYDITELGKNFSDFSINWVRREANSVAHVCASMVSATERSFFSFSDWLDHLVSADCNLAMNE